MKKSLRFLGHDDPIEISNTGHTILDHAIGARMAHLHECGGNGMCTTCRIRVLFGGEHLSKPTEQELIFRKQRNWKDDIRLACQAKVVSGDVLVEQLISSSAEISRLQLETVPVGIGEETDLVLLFCDMRNFTKLSERQTNFDMAHILNRFFTVMGDAILMNDGLIYQYAGDEIVALFGVGAGSSEKFCVNAIRAALGMTYAVERLNKWDLKHFDADIDVGIGLHYGHVFIGNVGHPQHKQFAVIGDSINVTSRIQNENRALDTRVLISKQMKEMIPEGTLKFGRASKVVLKGKSGAFDLFEVLGFNTLDVNLEVQSTIDALLIDEAAFSEKFYSTLFEKSPATRQLFSREMQQQGMLLTHMLRGIVHSLSRPEHLVAGIRELGMQHAQYGVKKDHYAVVGEVLTEVIEDQLGDLYTPNRKKAWERTIKYILSEMEAAQFPR